MNSQHGNGNSVGGKDEKKKVMPTCVRHLETFSSRIGAAIPTPVLNKEGQSCTPKQTPSIF